MARPKIGIFGALMALGGFLAVRYVQQRNRAAQIPVARELGRWENEGGAVAARRLRRPPIRRPQRATWARARMAPTAPLTRTATAAHGRSRVVERFVRTASPARRSHRRRRVCLANLSP
jgi:hypothetical protein